MDQGRRFSGVHVLLFVFLLLPFLLPIPCARPLLVLSILATICNRDAFSIFAPFVRSHMMRHVEARQCPRRLKIWMQWKQILPQVWRSLQKGKHVCQKMGRVRKSRVFFFRRAGRCSGLAIVVENDDLIDAENC